MVHQKKKSKNKRITLKRKSKVIKKVTEHHKKKAKQAQRQLGIDRKKLRENEESKLEKASVVSSADWTVKEQDLNALQAHRARTVDVVRKERAQKRKFELLEDDEEDQGFGNEAKGTAKNSGIVKIRDNSDRAFYKELAKVIEASDVILEVLDARDPIGTRCADVEKMVLRAGYEKHLVLLLNKIDLVPREAVEKWLKYLREELPTVAFKCSTQEQRSNLGWKSAPKTSKASKATAKPSNLLQTSDCLGAETLIKLLKNYSRSHEIKKSITVGVVGLPNVGKSSLINSLRRCHVVNVGATPGLTRSMQEVQLDKNVKLLDCPGVVMARSGESDASIALRNCKRIEKLDDPAGPVKEILKLCPAETLVSIYKIPNFGSSDEFLQNVATARGKLKKGGIIDVDSAARIVLHDWNEGKIPYYTMPPTRDAGVPSEAKIITELGKEFNIDEVYGTESFIGSLKSADDFQPTEMLASGTVTFDEKMAEDAMQSNNVVDQNNVNDDECMAEEDGADVKVAKTASGRQNEKLYATTDVLNTKIRKAEKKRRKKAKKLSAMEAKMESDDIEDFVEDAAMNDVDEEDQSVGNSSKNRFELALELDE
ncbi:guanine nucleotide-binding protein-like NSN1 [Heracleum sosnowskyi]|uniref:Guanine nucleotide-binding protein-like NSN1 n=1 Tax=Heracleum sosnowskyi TaxID=360622 RepID=A0AAD8GRJ7_9APIA|nr:guanine nucleotide-binding protein-like NSN1 [Heracleum sosnowskyi]